MLFGILTISDLIQIILPGRHFTVCEGDVFAISASGDQKRVVTMLTSMIRQNKEPG